MSLIYQMYASISIVILKFMFVSADYFLTPWDKLLQQSDGQ